MFFKRLRTPSNVGSLPQVTVQQLYPDNKTIQKLATLARSGDPEANYRMELHHLEDRKRDVVLAVTYLGEAAKADHLEARLQIAAALMHGFDDPSSLGRGFSLFCSFLALNIRSFHTDEMWVKNEVDAGSLTFAFLHCMAKIFGKQEHEAVALLTKQAREHGSMLATGALGYCYAEGKGLPQNFADAYIWFNLAAALGLRAATSDRERIAAKLLPEQLAEAQRRATDTFRSWFGPRA